MNWEPLGVDTALLVRPADLDSLGHVNNARILEYLETGRWAWLRAHQVDARCRVVPVVSRVQLDYLRQVSYGEVLVRTTLVSPDEDELELTFRVTFEQSVRAAALTDVVYAKAQLEVAFIDVATQRLASVADFLAAARAAAVVELRGAGNGAVAAQA